MPIRPNFVCLFKSRNTHEIRDVGLSRHEQALRRMANEARFHHQSVHNENATRMCGRGMRRAADQRVVVFLSHLPERQQSKETSSLDIWTGNCSKSFTLWTPTQTWTFYWRVSVTHRPAFASWSLVDGSNSLFGWNLRPWQFYKE